jgi:hypothetical protein
MARQVGVQLHLHQAVNPERLAVYVGIRFPRRKEPKVSKVIGVVTAVALALPAAAYAKGPDQAKITGPGLERAIVLNVSGPGEGGTGTMGRLTMEGGFFPEVFGDSRPAAAAEAGQSRAALPRRLPRFLGRYPAPGSVPVRVGRRRHLHAARPAVLGRPADERRLDARA